MTPFDKLKELMPDLKRYWVEDNGFAEIILEFEDGSEMGEREFMYGSEIRQLINQLK